MKLLARGSLILIVATLLTACVDRVRVAEPLERIGSSDDLVPQQLLVGVEGEQEPLNVNIVLQDKDLLLRALNTQFPSFRNDSLEDLIRDIESKFEGNRPPDTEEFEGLGGIFNVAFFRAARQTLGSDFDESKRVHLFVHGQIIAYEYNNQSNSPSNPVGAGNGRIGNIVYFTTVVTPETPRAYRGKNDSRVDAVRFYVTVSDPMGFEVYEREHGDPSRPFGDTLPFTRAMLSNVDLYGYEYKLWAEGDAIEIDEIATKDEGETDFTPLPTSDPRYTITAESCIDMLFQAYPPPSIAGLGPPFYCLGRCESPGLVNTNAS